MKGDEEQEKKKEEEEQGPQFIQSVKNSFWRIPVISCKTSCDGVVYGACVCVAV